MIGSPSPGSPSPGSRRLSSPVDDAGVALERALFEVKKVVVGQDRMVERMLVGLLAKGHLLIEGVPGVAKTLAVETFARVVGGTFSRIQFTPDLLPSDVTGVSELRISCVRTRTRSVCVPTSAASSIACTGSTTTTRIGVPSRASVPARTIARRVPLPTFSASTSFAAGAPSSKRAARWSL